MAAPVAIRSELELKRLIGLYAATAITVGNIIGSGIFRSPHSVAREVPDVGLAILAWVVGGVLSLCGSLVLAELAVAHPRTGGLYVFIREAFGDAWAFTFGWANLWVIKPTVIASITSVFALYFCQAVGLPRSFELPAGVAAILLLTLINWLGVREGARTQTLFTTLKVVGILGVCVAAFALRSSGAPADQTLVEPVGDRPVLLALVFAMIPVLFAYDGWTDVTYVGGEVKSPRRNLPLAILLGTALVIVMYVLTNLAFFNVLAPAEVATYEAVGAETMRRVLGTAGQLALAVLVAISTFGTTNGAILTGPRVTLAMAADGLLWKPLAACDVQRGSPGPALWVQAVLSCLWLWLAGGFEDVSGWFVTTSWLFYGLTIATVFVQRAREKALGKRLSEYRTPLHPLPAIAFILVTVAIIVSDLGASLGDPLPLGFGLSVPRAALGVIVAALGMPVYWLWKGRHRRPA
jgi:amino acid transporter